MNARPGTEAHPFGTAHPLPVRGRHTHCPFGTATPRYTLRRAPRGCAGTGRFLA